MTSSTGIRINVTCAAINGGLAVFAATRHLWLTMAAGVILMVLALKLAALWRAS